MILLFLFIILFLIPLIRFPLLINTNIKINLAYNELEYFCYLNHWLLFLFFFIVTFYSILKITTMYLNKIYYNDSFIELICTLFSLLFLLFIISPALIILLDIDSIIIPSFIIYSLGYQWAWTYSISYLHSNIGYSSYHDHYIVSSYFLLNVASSNYLFELNEYLVMPLWSCIKIYCFSLDVIHSLSFYSFGFKLDAIPGRINLTSSLRSLIKGVNRGFCYELCGDQHNTMLNTWIII